MLTIEHKQLSELLLLEQQGLCCYCELKASECDGHLEHLVPRSVAPNRTYDYSNLAISCNGGKTEHCGHYKDDRHHNPNFRFDPQLFSPPDDPQTETLFRFLSNGEIKEMNPNPSAVYMINYLGLDCSRLNKRRRAHAAGIIDTLGDKPDPETVEWLCHELLEPDASGSLHEFYSLSKAMLAV